MNWLFCRVSHVASGTTVSLFSQSASNDRALFAVEAVKVQVRLSQQ